MPLDTAPLTSEIEQCTNRLLLLYLPVVVRLAVFYSNLEDILVDDIDDTHGATSWLANGATIAHGMPGLSLRQTEPAQGQYSSSTWEGICEGQQYLHHDSTTNGHAQNGFSETFNSFPVAQMTQATQNHGLQAYSETPRKPWNGEPSPSHMAAEEMFRQGSQDSIGTHSQGTVDSTTSNYHDLTRSRRLYSDVSQVSFHMSSASSDVQGRTSSPDSSTLYTPTQQMDFQAFDNFSFQDGEDLAGHNDYHRDSVTSITQHPAGVSVSAGSTFGLFATAADEMSFASSLNTGSSSLGGGEPISQDSVIYNPNRIVEPARIVWDSSPTFLESRKSSPNLFDDDSWALPLQMISATNSPLDLSPSLEGQSSKYLLQDLPDSMDLPSYTTTSEKPSRKTVGSRPSKMAGDMAVAARRQRLPEASQSPSEVFKGVGRSIVEADNTARDHPLYHDVTVRADGLYHCPWEGQSTCQHRPEKLKCNYDKFVDSHLKPYRCKVLACENLHFSSTACLLRHEREAHAMHGHGDKPYLCPSEGCERGIAGNGFPRHWNLRDHMKRVHNDSGVPSPKGNASGSPTPSSAAQQPTRGSKKRKTEITDASHVDTQVKKVHTPRTASALVSQHSVEPSLIDQYNQSQQKLLETVKQLHDPKNTGNMALLQSASNCMKVMAHTTKRINGPPSLARSFSQQSG